MERYNTRHSCFFSFCFSFSFFSSRVFSVPWGGRGRDEGYVIWHMAWQERHDIKREEGEKNGKGRRGGYDDTQYGFVRTMLHSARLRKQHMGKESWKGEKGGKRNEPRFSLFFQEAYYVQGLWDVVFTPFPSSADSFSGPKVVPSFPSPSG